MKVIVLTPWFHDKHCPIPAYQRYVRKAVKETTHSDDFAVIYRDTRTSNTWGGWSRTFHSLQSLRNADLKACLAAADLELTQRGVYLL